MHDPADRANLAAARAAELFGRGELYCAESVLLALAEVHGVDSPLVPRIASGFCSGLSRRSGPCGALSGAVMGIGLVFGRDRGDQAIERCYTAVQRLHDRFAVRFGATGCGELTGCDLDTSAGRAEFDRRDLIVGRCAELTAETARLAQLVIDQQRDVRAEERDDQDPPDR